MTKKLGDRVLSVVAGLLFGGVGVVIVLVTVYCAVMYVLALVGYLPEDRPVAVGITALIIAGWVLSFVLSRVTPAFKRLSLHERRNLLFYATSLAVGGAAACLLSAKTHEAFWPESVGAWAVAVMVAVVGLFMIGGSAAWFIAAIAGVAADWVVDRESTADESRFDEVMVYLLMPIFLIAAAVSVVLLLAHF